MFCQQGDYHLSVQQLVLSKYAGMKVTKKPAGYTKNKA